MDPDLMGHGENRLHVEPQAHSRYLINAHCYHVLSMTDCQYEKDGSLCWAHGEDLTKG